MTMTASDTSAPSRRGVAAAILALGLALGLAAAAPAAHAEAPRDAGAEQFVQAAAQKVLTTLSDKSASATQRKAAFHEAVNQLVDVPKITTFVLGKYARTITPAQSAQFTQAFRRYAETVYENRLNEYRGASLKVVGSVVRKPGDVIVNTQLTGGPPGPPLAVSWRVLGSGSNWKVVDMQFKGVWLAITQQQDFVSTIDNAGGDVGVLIAQLQRDAQKP
ncbi:MAG: ABC transporter substrate-binding protein [Caulobacterales bacterium]|nr:ABC transporter substrate-binding protein [Caulobacterales bacterium]